MSSPLLRQAVNVIAWRNEHHADGYAWVEGFERYFGEEYPRGNWPKIKAAIFCAIKHFPSRDIYYSADSEGPEEAQEATKELIDALDLAWQKKLDGRISF